MLPVNTWRRDDAAVAVPAATMVAPAARYAPVDDLWIVTTHYNPAGYARRQRHSERFRAHLHACGLRVLTVECAFGDQPFLLAPAPDVLRVRARDVLWQKERLINLAIASLPPACTKVAWIDSDVLFENPAWAVETSRLLDRVALAQPFASIIRLPRDAEVYTGTGHTMPSMAAVLARDPHAARTATYDRHGDTGMAWAARRELLAHGLYDACIAGGGDHAMAHAAAGAWEAPCLSRIIGGAGGYRAHFMRWAEPFHRAVGGAIGVVDGSALHLWHGDTADRHYVDRHHALNAFGFDPHHDLRVGAGGCWEWATAKPELHAWMADYFHRRREDGDGDA